MKARLLESSKKLDLLVLLLLGLWALAFWKLRLIDPASEEPLRRNLGNVDLFTYILPVGHALRDSWLSGELPLWNPYQAAGHPLLATLLPGVFYPLNFPYLLLPAHLAIEAVTVLHLAVGAWFMFFLARSWDVDRIAAMVAAAVFSFSGYVVFNANWFTPALAACVWLPAAVLAVDRIVERGDLRWASGLAFAIAMPVLAGWLQLWTYSLYAIGLYAAVLLCASSTRRGLSATARAGICVALGVGLGLALASVQLFPSYELQTLSPRRTGGLSARDVMLFGGTNPLVLAVGAVEARIGAPRWTYLGLPALALIPLSVFARGLGVRVVALWCILFFGAGVAMTVHGEGGSFFFALPAATWFREPQRILLLYAFAGAALSGLGMHALVARNTWGGRWLRPLVAVVAAGLVLSLTSSVAAITLFALVLGLTAAVCAVGGDRPRAALYAALGLVTVADPFIATRNTLRHPIHDPEIVHAEQAALDFIRDRQSLDRSLLLGRNHLDFQMMAKHGTLERIYSITDYEPLSLGRRGRFFDLMKRPARSPERPFNGFLDPDVGSPHFELLDLMSVRFLAVHHRDLGFRGGIAERAPDWSLAYERHGGDFIVYENRNALPRAYLAFDARAVADEDAAFAALVSPNFDPRRSVILEGLPHGSAGPVDGERPIEEVEVVTYEPRRVVIRTESAAEAIVVLTDTAYPGWRVQVDGRPQGILTANSQFRAVLLEPGSHRVEFRFLPTSFVLGSAVSLLVLAGILVGLYFTQRR